MYNNYCMSIETDFKDLFLEVIIMKPARDHEIIYQERLFNLWINKKLRIKQDFALKIVDLFTLIPIIGLINS